MLSVDDDNFYVVGNILTTAVSLECIPTVTALQTHVG